MTRESYFLRVHSYPTTSNSENTGSSASLLTFTIQERPEKYPREEFTKRLSVGHFVNVYY